MSSNLPKGHQIFLKISALTSDIGNIKLEKETLLD